ncbi:Predicted dehydrogenase [Natronoarchaeum philippinense]|uniref:Predicted dehydrogenase n=1 Tax=Natronoarchaeum philippinense TaxID=558529 RepID=A0A285P664_NATPI|nr:Gfo/Idh/MocA family oxidoreductase [Natronoarchaeum philippinense]SNZ16938.1 Predicted dehydrogenase [Natronoarchaeum philippinense]
MTQSQLRTGVIGVGSMGQHHARVYRELPETRLVGVADADADAARAAADTYETAAMEIEELLDAVDAVSIAVPTPYHYETASAALDSGVDVLVEKPFVDSLDAGRRLIDRARERGRTLQVGHIERFNPAVRALTDIVPDLNVIAVDARRLGPPLDRDLETSAVLDLMIHDIDVLLALIGDDVTVAEAAGTADGQYVTATVELGDGVIGSLTASRVTQQKVRELSITAEECQVHVDYISRSVQIHRHSIPEYIERNGDIRYRHENIVEHPTVDNGEPLKKELSAFASAVEDGTEPVVTAEDGLKALELAREIEDEATASAQLTAKQ